MVSSFTKSVASSVTLSIVAFALYSYRAHLAESGAKSTFTSACRDSIQDYPGFDLLLCLNSPDVIVCVIGCQLEPLIFSGDVLVDSENNQHLLPAECAVLDTSSFASNAAFHVFSAADTCGKVREGIIWSLDNDASVVGAPEAGAKQEEVAEMQEPLAGWKAQ